MCGQARRRTTAVDNVHFYVLNVHYLLDAARRDTSSPFRTAFSSVGFAYTIMSQSFLSPKTSTPRPALPYTHANPFLTMGDQTGKTPAVKYQVITREGQEIIVGRVKIQTPSGHAFVLRRFDTGAISLTTMFRAAFPTAPEDYEKVEASWVKANYDSYGANGTGRDAASKLRLAGTWIHPDVALTLAPHYSLEHVIEPLTTVHPDPSQEYRRSTKPQSPHVNANTNPSPSKAGPRIEVNAPPASPSPASGPAAKRRKESSPVVAAPIPVESLPPPRRSGRTSISPAPQAARPPRSKGTRTTRGQVKPASVNGRVSTRLTPAESDHAPPAEDAEGDDIAEVPGPDMSQDIAEQKEMIAKLKAERDAKASSTKLPPAEPIVKTESQASKRSREEEEKPLQFNFKEPDEENAVVARPIASNSRLSLDLEPQQKSAAWGALWFAAGLAAAATIPSLFM